MCCTRFAHNCAWATWEYVLETVRGTVRRLSKSRIAPLNAIIIIIITPLNAIIIIIIIITPLNAIIIIIIINM